MLEVSTQGVVDPRAASFTMLEGVLDELLVALNSFFEISNRQRLVVGMGYQNVPRTIEISRVVALEVRHIRTVVDRDRLEACRKQCQINPIAHLFNWTAERRSRRHSEH